MDKLLLRNLNNAKWVIGGFGLAHTTYWIMLSRPRIHSEVFGWDGNGGQMLKIITDLTDEEIAKLKYARRSTWHWNGLRSQHYAKDTISDQELSDRGIEIP